MENINMPKFGFKYTKPITKELEDFELIFDKKNDPNNLVEKIMVSTAIEFKKLREKQEKHFIDSIYKNAVPKIKGEITKGKLKWRGIKYCFRINLNGTISEWIQQRDKIIS